jgi:hypothetical protein
VGKQIKKKFFGMVNPFELQDEFDETSCIEYYSGVEGRTIDRITCPEHVFEVLDNVHSMIMNEKHIKERERDFMLNMLSKLMDKVEPCCRELLM